MTKAEWRRGLRDARAGLTPADRAAAGQQAAAVLAEHWDELGSPRSVAAYLSVGTEPETDALLRVVLGRGARLLLPILLEDDDLAWGVVDDTDALTRLRPGRRGIPEPTGERSPLDAALVICPALAVDADGNRLGQGGGSYDRALTRAPKQAVTLAYVFENEVLDAGVLPHDAHDVAVGGALTPTRLVTF